MGTQEFTSPSTPAPRPPAEVPRHRREHMLRGDIKTYVGKVAHRLYGGANLSEATRDVNTQLLKAGFPQRKKASVEQLEEIRTYLARWLDKL